MKVLGIQGPATETHALVARLVPRLDGRVATVDCHTDVADVDGAVDRAAADADPLDGISSAYRRSEGAWTARAADWTVGSVLDELAPSHDVALVLGADDLRVPFVSIGDGQDPARNPDRSILAADAADGVDLDELLDALDRLEPHVTLEALVHRLKTSPHADRSGAIATFTGRVRAKDSDDDDRTTKLAFEKYEGVADDQMATIRDELTARDGVFEVLMHHRTGVIPDGEDIVFVVVLAGHRKEAFRAVEDGIDRLKAEVPIFKKETTVSDEFWVHDRS